MKKKPASKLQFAHKLLVSIDKDQYRKLMELSNATQSSMAAVVRQLITNAR